MGRPSAQIGDHMDMLLKAFAAFIFYGTTVYIIVAGFRQHRKDNA